MVLSAETNMHLRLYLLPSLFMLGAAFGIKMQSPAYLPGAAFGIKMQSSTTCLALPSVLRYNQHHPCIRVIIYYGAKVTFL